MEQEEEAAWIQPLNPSDISVMQGCGKCANSNLLLDQADGRLHRPDVCPQLLPHGQQSLLGGLLAFARIRLALEGFHSALLKVCTPK